MVGQGPYRAMKRARLQQGPFSISAVEPDAIEAIRRWRNAQTSILRQSDPISAPEQSSYFDSVIWPDKPRKEPANILVSFFEDERVVGYGGLVHINWAHKRAEVSFLLDPSFLAEKDRHDQLAFVLIALIKGLAFQDLGLRRLTTETYETRACVIPILERSGFRAEGVLRRHVVKDGVIYDAFIHGCLAEDDDVAGQGRGVR